MGTENQAPSPDLGSLLSGLGISGASLSGGAYADPSDRELIWDREDRWPAKPLPGDIRMMEQGAKAPRTPVIKRETDAEKHLYNRPDSAEVTELQRRLWAGGFYPPGTSQDDIIPGMPDYHTEKAWLTLLDRAAKYKNAGKDMTVWEILDEGANIMKAQGKEPGAVGRAPLVVDLANPDDLKYIAQKTAVGTLGRALRSDEIERFVSSFHSSQRSAQTQAYNAGGTGGPGGSAVSAPSPTVAAEQFARQADPTAAGAHDAVKVFDVVSRVLGGRRGGR